MIKNPIKQLVLAAIFTTTILIGAACSQTQGESLTDVKANLEAEIGDIKAREAVMQATAEAIALAIDSIQATAEAIPSPTPITPTATPVPTSTYTPTATPTIIPTATPTPIPTPTPTPMPTPTPVPTVVPEPTSTTISTSELVKIVSPSVIYITTEQAGGSEGSGTAFIYSEDGLALTNHHVVSGATTILATILDDQGIKQTVPALLLGTNSEIDIALIQLDGGPYHPAPIGSVDNITVGDEVVAMGYPLAQITHNSLTATKGIVSNIRNDGLRKVIQHQASVNPGNSGGPLLNQNGLVVGMNTYIVRTSENVNIEGFNVAIAIDEVVSRIDDLALNPGSYYYSLATTLFRNGSYQNAISNYTKAINLDSNYVSAYLGRGAAYGNIGMHELAIVDFNMAIQIDPNSALAFHNRGIANYHLGEFNSSLEDLNEALRLDPFRAGTEEWVNRLEDLLRTPSATATVTPAS